MMFCVLRRKVRCLLPVIGLLLCFGGGLQAKEYFVAKTGADGNDGASRETAFLTVQKGVNVIAPGDTLTILPGEYFEAVERKALGNKNSKTVIRADIPGTVILRGDVLSPKFEAVNGLSRVYVAEFKQDVQTVVEIDTLALFEPMPNEQELELHPGSYFYDAKTSKLYIATTDFAPPTEHAYSISVLRNNGIFLNSPVGVEIDGIVACGFNSNREEKSSPGKFTVWGVLLFEAQNCTIKNVAAYLNGGGLAISASKGHNVIEDCVAGGNISRFAGSGGNILIFSANNDEILRCVAYRSPQFGLRLYGGMTGPSAIKDSLGWGNLADLFIKGAGVEKYGSSVNSVAVGAGHVFNIKNGFVGAANIYRGKGETPKDTIVQREENFDANQEFADAINFDYRLQAHSRFRGAGPDGADRGPFPYRADIFYVKPSGNDEADGLSYAGAWKTLGRAVSQVRPGDTVYVAKGIYDESVTLDGVDGEKGISIRGRGVGSVVIKGAVVVKNSRNVDFERLSFAGSVTAENSKKVAFNNCYFSDADFGITASDCPDLRVTHCEFTDFKSAAVLLDAGRNAFLSNNIFNNIHGAAIDLAAPRGGISIYSDYNSYADPAKAWRIEGKDCSLDQLVGLGERYSIAGAPVYSRINGVPQLDNAGLFAGRGAGGKNLGFSQDILSESVHMTKPEVHSVSATTANIEWLLSERAECLVAWGPTPECENETVWEADQYGSFSLTGLTPGTTYYFRIKSMRWVGSITRDAGPARVINPKFEPISFVTATKDAEPQTYYVAPEGKDADSGSSRDQAWRTVAYAASRVNVGDTVLISSGTYAERVRVRATGVSAKAITFKSIPGEKVVFSSADKLLDSAWVIDGKNHIVIDGFYFGQYRVSGGSTSSHRIFDIYRSDDVSISRCFFDGRGGGYANGFLTAYGSKNLSVTNCVLISGFNHIGVRACAGFRLEHNVFICPMIQATMLSPEQGDQYRLTNNIFTDNSAFKVKVNLHEWGGALPDILDEDNCYFLRVPDAQRKLYWLLSFEEKGQSLGHTRMSLEEYRKRVRSTSSLIADPMFAFFKDSPEKYDQPFLVDAFLKNSPHLDFYDFFSTNPVLEKRSIGLQPEKFSDFHFAEKLNESSAASADSTKK